MLAADLIRNFEDDLKTVAFTPVVLPVSSQVNGEFGKPGHVNVAAKLYFLYRDTDIDFTWLGGGSRTPRFGVDFSRNLTSAMEIHGEWARIRDFEQRVVDPAGTVSAQRGNATSYLLGARYLTERDTTYILEYYRNATGYTEAQAADFYRLVDNGVAQFQSAGSDALLRKAIAAGQGTQGGYGRPNAGERYLYLRVSQKEPFDIVYFTPSVTLIANLDDRSYSLTPELLYTGVTNLDLRLRAMCAGRSCPHRVRRKAEFAPPGVDGALLLLNDPLTRGMVLPRAIDLRIVLLSGSILAAPHQRRLP